MSLTLFVSDSHCQTLDLVTDLLIHFQKFKSFAFYIHACDIVWTHIVTGIGMLSILTFRCDCIASALCLRTVNHSDVSWPLGLLLCATGFSFSSSPVFGLLLLCSTFCEVEQYQSSNFAVLLYCMGYSGPSVSVISKPVCYWQQQNDFLEF